MGHCHEIREPELPGTLQATRACNGTDLRVPTGHEAGWAPDPAGLM